MISNNPLIRRVCEGTEENLSLHHMCLRTGPGVAHGFPNAVNLLLDQETVLATS
jgi:hypothetical protein